MGPLSLRFALPTVKHTGPARIRQTVRIPDQMQERRACRAETRGRSGRDTRTVLHLVTGARREDVQARIGAHRGIAGAERCRRATFG